MGKNQQQNRLQAEKNQGLLPNFCDARNLFIMVVSAELLAMVLTLSSDVASEKLLYELSMRSLYVQWIALASTAILCALHTRLNQMSNTMAGLAAWLIFQGTTLLVSEVAFQFMKGTDQSLGLIGGHQGFLLRNLGVSAIVAALGLHYLYIQFLWHQQIVAESQARLQALQSRIRPHFLFNCMNTIASLTRTRPEVAEEAVHDLADLFRASLSSVEHKSTLGDELELVRGYLRIEGLRLGDRLQVEWELDGLPEEATMPLLVLQPLLENAVYHGIEPSPQGGRILVAGCYSHHQVSLSIRNTKPPEGCAKHNKGNHMALENIRQRLEGLFYGEASLTISEVDGDYQVQLIFPYSRTGA
ncbi:hypothetical protein MNBD_GAMMA26-736 [hydrothermal vent metagenome]|uniref:Signal transduction histidine kinase internal region domain-containing protein n=1 Tax=hydrothermal vent metagenome TaxID=652676 RepID=A0A3B1AND2_9ZZZZ